MKKGYAKLLLPIAAIVAVFASINAAALSDRNDVYIEFTTSSDITISLSSNDVSIDNLIPGTADVSNEINVTVSTNSESGYLLGAVVGNDSSNTTNLVPTDSSIEDTFISIDTGIYVTEISEDRTWGFSTDHGANFTGLPIYRTDDPAIINVTNDPSVDEIPFLIGARANRFQAPGEYRNVVTFTAIANPIPNTIATTRYMQDINDDVYASMEMEKQYQLIDKRDNKKYWVAKLKDGNVWMTQNLNFELTTPETVLYPDTSNTTSKVTLSVADAKRDVEVGAMGWGGPLQGGSFWYDSSKFYPSDIDSDTYVPGGTFNAGQENGNIIFTTEDYLVSTEDLDADNENWHYATGGRYYHNNNSPLTNTEALCPKGWILPSNESSDQYSLQKLINEYPTMGTAPTYFTTTPFESGFRYVEDSEIDYERDSLIYFATASYGWGVMYFKTDSSSGKLINYGNNGGRGYNRYASIRCVASRTSVYPFTYYLNFENQPEIVYYYYEPASWGGADASIKAISLDNIFPQFGKGDFIGWATTPDATEPDYLPGDTIITNTDTPNNLYAVWQTLTTSFDDAFAAAGKTKVDGEHYAMQDMTPELCASVSTNMATVLVDTRDGNTYKVAKLKRDRNGAKSTCWMIENLALGSTNDEYVLTPQDTNISSNFTLPAVASGATSSTTPQFNVYYGQTDNFGGKAGNSYNLFAATAGSDDAKVSSICPKGWQIPGGLYYSVEDDTDYYSYRELSDAYPNFYNNEYRPFEMYYDGAWTSSRGVETDTNSSNYGKEFIRLSNGSTIYLPTTTFAKIRCVVKPSN